MKVILLVGTLLLCLLQETHSGAIPTILKQSNTLNNEEIIDPQPIVLQELDKGQNYDKDINDVDYLEALKLKSDIDVLLNEFMTVGKGTDPIVNSRQERFFGLIAAAIVGGFATGAITTFMKELDKELGR